MVRRLARSCVTAVACLVVGSEIARAAPPLPGDNVNMVSGRTWPGGDPFGQRQNEPSIAVSSANPKHLLAGANDYRTVNFTIDPSTITDEHADGWLSYLRSLDGGATWQSYLLAGFPEQNGNPFSSPLFGLQAASDPVVRTGTNGLFYYAGIAFNRNSSKGAVFVARFIDLNNQESGDITTGNDPIKYVDTTVVDVGVDKGTGNPPAPISKFQDKPWIATDVPRSGAGSCTVNGQTFPAGNVYIAYATFFGPAPQQYSQIKFRRSTNCGVTWSSPVVLAGADEDDEFGPDDEDRLYQGAAVAVDPRNGDVWVAWRRYAPPNASSGDAIMVVRSTDGGQHFQQPMVFSLSPTQVYEQDIGPGRFRNEMFPTMAIGVAGAKSWVHVAWTARDANGDGRIFLATKDTTLDTSASGHWSTPQLADPGPFTEDGSGYTFTRGRQLMPSLHFSQGQLMLLHYDSYLDHTSRYYELNPDFFLNHVPGAPMFRQWVGPFGATGAGSTLADDLSGQLIFDPFSTSVPNSGGIDDAALSTTSKVGDLRHSLDVRVVQFPPGGFAGCANVAPPCPQSARVTSFPFGDDPSGPATAPLFQGGPLTLVAQDGTLHAYAQKQFNPPNLPMFANGTVPFMGDYIDIQGQAIVQDPVTGAWKHNTDPVPTPVFFATYTSNQDVRGPPAGHSWANYTPPGSITLGANGWSATVYPTCAPGQTSTPASPCCDPTLSGMRDQNVYATRITQGLLVSSVQNAKPLDLGVQRSFVIEIRNTTDFTYGVTFQLPSVNWGALSFQSLALASLGSSSLNVAPHSIVYQTVFARRDSSSVPPATAIPVAWGSLQGGLPGGAPLTSLPNTLALNGTSANGLLESGGNSVTETYLALVTSQNVTSQNVTSQNVTSQNVTSAPVTTQNVTSQNVTSQNVTSMTVAAQNVTSQNVTSQNVTSQNVTSQNVTSASVVDVNYTVTNNSNTTTGYNVTLFGPAATQAVGAQLILYSTYFTQAVDPFSGSCTLSDVPHTYVTTVVNDPQIYDINSTNLGDPNSSAARATNATFVLAPGETKQITVRNLVQSVSDSLPGVPVTVAHGSTGAFTAPPVITSTSATLAAPRLNVPYAAQLAATGGAAPYAWSLIPNPASAPFPAPPGLTVSAGGAVGGWTPAAAGSYSFTVRLKDANSPADAQCNSASCPTATFTVQVAKEATKAGLGASQAGAGGAVTFTASVSAAAPVVAAGPTLPTGNVTFYDCSAACSSGPGAAIGTQALAANDTATLTTASLAAGKHVVTAVYAGDGNFTAIGSPALRIATTTTSLGAGSSSVYGTTMVFPVTVTGADGATPASGTVTVYDQCSVSGGAVTGTAAGNAQVVGAASTSVTVNPLTAGSHTLCAAYAPPASSAAAPASYYLGSASSTQAFLLTVPAAQETVTLVNTGVTPVGGVYTATYGQPFKLTATVSTTALGVSPTGSVVFEVSGSQTTSTVALTGASATFDVAAAAAAMDPLALLLLHLDPGTYTLTATYTGDTVFASAAGSLTQQVVAASTTVSLTSSPNPAVAGATVTLTANVSPSTVPGSVVFYDACTSGVGGVVQPGTALGTAVTVQGGSAQLATSALTVGAHPLCAVFTSGSVDDQGSTSGIQPQQVNPSWTFTGFLAPLATASTVPAPPYSTITSSSGRRNTTSSVPVIWTLQGAPTDSTGTKTVASLYAYFNVAATKAADCATFALPSLPPAPPPPSGSPWIELFPIPKGSSGLQYRVSGNVQTYQVNWDASTVKPGCYGIVLSLKDGSAPRATTLFLGADQ